MAKDKKALKDEYELVRKQYSENNNDIKVCEHLAEVCIGIDKLKEAEKIYCALVEKFPDTSKYNYRLGKVLFSLEKYKEALVQQEQALKKWEGFNWAKLEKIKCLVQLNRANETSAILDSLSNFIPVKDDEKIFYKNLLKIKIEICELKGELAEAFSISKTLISFDPSDGFSHYNCGKILLELKDYNEALRCFYEADKLLRQNYIKDKIATCLVFLDRKQEAVEIYKLIPFQRMDDYILQHLGRLYLLMSDYENSKKLLKLAIVKGGKSIAKSHFFLGIVFEKLGLIKNALKEFNLAQEIKKKEYNSDYSEALDKINYIQNNCKIDENELLESYEDKTDGLNEHKYGIIEKYIDNRGFGFIRENETNKYFFHFKNCLYKNPKEKDKVKYLLIEGKKGKEATKIEQLTR